MDFLQPIYEAVLDQEEFLGTWLKDKREWRRIMLENDALSDVR